MKRTAGQELAISQLDDICDFSDGSLSHEIFSEPTDECSFLKVALSISTRHHRRVESGIPLKKRERVILSLPTSFPIDYPSVDTPHKRFAGYSHVQWTNHICLYLSPEIEWSPKDGMFGFINRLNKWFGAAALDQLDPDDAPLHPPVIYNGAQEKIVVRENTPNVSSDSPWIGSAAIKPIQGYRFDLVEWRSKISDIQKPSLVAAAILLNIPFPMEYPVSVNALVKQLETHGLDFVELYLIMKKHVEALTVGEPLFVILGTPMRRRDPHGPIKQHLAIWRIDDEATNSLREIVAGDDDQNTALKAFVTWSINAGVAWCRIDEARNEVTLDRGNGSAASTLKGKRILLLGCGALGSHAADILVRAGIASIKVVDNGIVSSGVLTRQQYYDIDIGCAKATVCKDRLLKISPSCDVKPGYENLKYGVFSKFGSEFDLVINATASRAVTEAIEIELRDILSPPPILSISVSTKAEFGRIVVRNSSAAAGLNSIVRSAQIACHSNPLHETLAKAFWPKTEEIELFQPEPGCSEPTFQASNADMMFHAASLLNVGLAELKTKEATNSIVTFVPNVKNGYTSKSTRIEIADPKKDQECKHDYSVYSMPAATMTIDAEIRRNSRVNGKNIETGGLMFGEVDDSLRIIHLDNVTGPPSDSILTPKLFVCGTAENQERNSIQKNMTGGVSSFIGIWHTHPISPPKPSDVDLGAMHAILEQQDFPPRHTVMLIIGHAATKPEWAFYLFRRGELDSPKRIIRVMPVDA